MQFAHFSERARRSLPDDDVGAPTVGLSTSSVFPDSTISAFALAAQLGYDGIELMVGTDAVSTDVDRVRQHQDEYQMPVLSVHAPCLMFTPRIWGLDPGEKLRRSCEAARLFGSNLVVVHPPFAWQRAYARAFSRTIRELSAEYGVIIAVENMYPWRAPGVPAPAYAPDWDPTDEPYDWLTLDLSHAAIAGARSLNYVDDWGPRLRHLHLTDGSGSMLDEHLMPGEGNQRAWEVVETLVARGYSGHIIHEVNTRKSGDADQRAELLAACLSETRQRIAAITSATGSEG